MINNLKIRWKLMSLLFIAVFGVLIIGSISLYKIKDILLEEKKSAVRNVATSAASVLAQYAAKEKENIMTREEAEKAAFDTLRGVRYGNNDYFFAYQWDGTNRMLGPKPSFEGKNRLNAKDKNGVPYIKQLVKGAKDGGGFSFYSFPRAGEKTPSPKMAYAAPYKPWKMFIGTGVYIDDIDKTFIENAKSFSFAAGILLIIMSTVVYYISNSITGPLSKITSSMKALANGDKSVEVLYLDNKTEIGDLARALLEFKENAIKVDKLLEEQKLAKVHQEEERKRLLNEMANNFESSVKDIVTGVSSAAIEMQGSAKSLSGTAEETTRQSAAVGAAAESAANGVQTVASAAEELNASIGEITTQTNETVRVAGVCVSEADKTSTDVQELSKAAEDIESVVNLIEDIASQVNLLALNATIEAARAGEAGKGFAVVANEVKNLAEQTGNATKEIATQITNIQEKTDKAVDSIGVISDTIKKVNEISTTVAAAAEEQGAATQEISRSVQKTSQDTSEVSENIGGVKQAAAETSEASTQMLETAAQLSEESETLRKTVDDFITHIRRS